MNVGHFGHGHFGLGRFGHRKCQRGRFGHNHILWVGVDSMHVLMHTCVMHFLGLTVYSFLPVFSYVLEALGNEKCN